MSAQIDLVCKEVNDLLEKNKDFIDVKHRKDIEKKIDLLTRLKRSNSISHLQEMTNRIMEELQE